MISADTLATATKVLSGIGDVVSLLYPPAGPFIGIAERLLPYIVAATPLVTAAFNEGMPALAAAEKAAPELTSALKGLFTLTGIDHASTQAENMIRTVFTIPHLTPEEERSWMDRMTPGNDPSQENSKFTVG